MKKSIIIFLAVICLFSCTQKKQTLQFKKLSKEELSTIPFKLPDDKIIDSVKKVHDNCMGFSFDANVFLAEKKDSFGIGTIINRKTQEKLNTINDLGLSLNQMANQFNILTNPCYEKRVLQVPLRSVLGKGFYLQLPGVDKETVREINDAINSSTEANIESGSWIYLDMKAILRNMMDTAKSPLMLEYKKNLLDTANVTLIAAESVMNTSFIIRTSKNISAPLQKYLQTKPSVVMPNSTPSMQSSLKLFYLGPDKFEVSIDGLFPVVGEFVKVVLE